MKPGSLSTKKIRKKSGPGPFRDRERLVSNGFFMASLYVMRIQPEVWKRGATNVVSILPATSSHFLREREGFHS